VFKFPKLLANLSLISPRKVATNVNCSVPSTAEMMIAHVPSSSFLTLSQAYVCHGWPKISCMDLDLDKKTGTGMTMPLTLTGMYSSTFVKSEWLPLAVIIFQSARFHPMFNSVGTSVLVTQITHPRMMSMGSLCPNIFPRTVGEHLEYRNFVYQMRCVRPENADT